MSSQLTRLTQGLKRSSADFDSNLIQQGLFHEFDSLCSELATSDKCHHSDTHLALNPELTYLGEPNTINITKVIHHFQSQHIPPSVDDRGTSLPPAEQLMQTHVTFPFEGESTHSYSTDPEITFKKMATQQLDTLIEDLESFAHSDLQTTLEYFESALDTDDPYIDDTIADYHKMADGFDGYEQPNMSEHPSSHLLNSFGTHANTSWDVLDGAGHHHQSADTSVAALSQIIAELSQISANQSHFKEGLEKLNDNQQQLHNQNIVTADLVAGL